MSGGSSGGGYRPQDNTSALLMAQMQADERRREAEKIDAQHAANNAINQRLHEEQVAENNRINREAAERRAIEEERAYNDRIRSESQARIDAENKRVQDAAAAAKAEADAKETARIQRSNQAKTTVDSSARARASSKLASLGANDYLDEAMAEYDRILAGIPEGDPNPGSYYSSDILNSLIADAENERRSRYTTAAATSFGAGFENSYIPDTADDAYIDKLLTGRSGEAQKSIDYARARGQLNDAGYSSALGKFEEQKGAARGTLNSIGNSVIGTKRAALSPIRDEAFGAASNYRLGNPEPDFAGYTSRARSLADNSLAGLEGDILGALGNTSLFNINDIILAGGRGQGPINLTSANIPARLKKNNESDRGLGTTGAF